MEKKNYSKPTMKVVMLKERARLLYDSEGGTGNPQKEHEQHEV